jgi:hypothetical protein
MTSRAISRILITGAALAAVALVPIPYLACPSWRVRVVDGSGTPVEGMTVRLVYQNYSVEADGHEEDQTTDRQGDVTFPARRSSASAARLCMFTLRSACAGPHASFGRHAYVFAFGKGREGYAASGKRVADWSGVPAEVRSRITAAP